MEKYGLVKRGKELVVLAGLLDRELTHRHYDLNAVREVGLAETIDTVEAYTRVFDKMRKA